MDGVAARFALLRRPLRRQRRFRPRQDQIAVVLELARLPVHRPRQQHDGLRHQRGELWSHRRRLRSLGRASDAAMDSLWTGSRESATTAWPPRRRADGQEGVLGMPRFDPRAVRRALRGMRRGLSDRGDRRSTPSRTGADRLDVDYGRCVVCQLCVEACPTDAARLFVRLGFWRDRAFRSQAWRAARVPPRRTGLANPAGASVAACMSAMSMPAPATAASRNCRRSTIPSTTCIGSAFSSRLRRVSPICCSSPAPSPTRCANPCDAPTKRCRSLAGSWRSGDLRGLRRGRSGRICVRQPASRAFCRSISIFPVARPIRRPSIEALLMFLDRSPRRVSGGRHVK